ncbi:hypothetical protein IRJ41_022475 [Triplophysa rosa]|uniref:Uncharacterized protein n=1 Tax=Triplophysa rosa TaxID=992332 RepID=A0A9W7X139_TRIRA|nr:hypothetical protein IRJ41_022475 [Triplophysa rosa]
MEIKYVRPIQKEWDKEIKEGGVEPKGGKIGSVFLGGVDVELGPAFHLTSSLTVSPPTTCHDLGPAAGCAPRTLQVSGDSKGRAVVVAKKGKISEDATVDVCKTSLLAFDARSGEHGVPRLSTPEAPVCLRARCAVRPEDGAEDAFPIMLCESASFLDSLAIAFVAET